METRGILYLSIALITFAFTHITDKIGISHGVDPSVFSFFSVSFGLCFIAGMWIAVKRKKHLSLS